MSEPADTGESTGFCHAALYCPASGVLQTKKSNHRAPPPLRLPKLASRCPWSRVEDILIYKPIAIVVELHFLSVFDPQLECLGWDPTELGNNHHGEDKKY